MQRPDPVPATTGELAAMVAALATDEAVRARSQGAWLERQAAEEGTFAGALADLGERGRPVALHLHGGRRHLGVISVLGTDFVGLRTAGGREVFVNLDALASVRTLAGESPTIGDRAVVAMVSLADAVAALAEDRARVLVVGTVGDAASGELRTAGRDVLTVRLDGDGGTAYVALASVAEISLAVSG